MRLPYIYVYGYTAQIKTMNRIWYVNNRPSVFRPTLLSLRVQWRGNNDTKAYTHGRLLETRGRGGSEGAGAGGRGWWSVLKPIVRWWMAPGVCVLRAYKRVIGGGALRGTLSYSCELQGDGWAGLRGVREQLWKPYWGGLIHVQTCVWCMSDVCLMCVRRVSDVCLVCVRCVSDVCLMCVRCVSGVCLMCVRYGATRTCRDVYHGTHRHVTRCVFTAHVPCTVHRCIDM